MLWRGFDIFWSRCIKFFLTVQIYRFKSPTFYKVLFPLRDFAVFESQKCHQYTPKELKHSLCTKFHKILMCLESSGVISNNWCLFLYEKLLVLVGKNVSWIPQTKFFLILHVQLYAMVLSWISRSINVSFLSCRPW